MTLPPRPAPPNPARGFLDDDKVRKSDLVDISAELRHETERAWLVFDGAREAWLAKALLEREGDVFTMPEWLAKEKKLI